MMIEHNISPDPGRDSGTPRNQRRSAPKVKNKARNNFSKLSWEARKRVLFLLYDGAEYDAVRNDPEVAEACRARNLTLHNTTFQAIRRSDEYADYGRAREKTGGDKNFDRWAAEALRDTAGITSVADLTQMRLLESLRAVAEGGSDDPDELLKIASAVAKIKAADAAGRIAKLERDIAAVKAEAERQKTEHEETVGRLTATITERDATISELRKRCGESGVDNVIEAVDRFVRGD